MISAQDVAEIMGGLTKVHTVESGKVVCHCPVATWEHHGGTDSSPSFAVMRGRTGWWVNCLACRYRKTLEGLIWDIQARTKKPLVGAMVTLYHKDYDSSPVEKAPIEEITYNPLGGYRGKPQAAFKRREYATNIGVQTNLFGEPVAKYDAKEERPDVDMLERWERMRPPLEYVEDRGITYEAYKEWRLGHDAYRRRLMFPVFNRDGSYVGYTGRLYYDSPTCFGCGEMIMEDHVNGRTGEVKRRMVNNCPNCGRSYAKYKHFKGKWRRNVVYGLNRQVEGDKPIVVTEGTMDAIRLWMLGVARPVCILGANLSPNQVTELKEACSPNLDQPIIFLGDGDDAGKEMARDGVERMKRVGVSAFAVDCPASDPDNMTLDEARAILPAVAFRSAEES